jgi:hypothetical protein
LRSHPSSFSQTPLAKRIQSRPCESNGEPPTKWMQPKEFPVRESREGLPGWMSREKFQNHEHVEFRILERSPFWGHVPIPRPNEHAKRTRSRLHVLFRLRKEHTQKSTPKEHTSPGGACLVQEGGQKRHFPPLFANFSPFAPMSIREILLLFSKGCSPSHSWPWMPASASLGH